MQRFLWIIVALVLAAACACEAIPPKTVRIENIERIFMHERGKYTFLVLQEDGVTLHPITVNARASDERFVTDVPDGMPAWATYQLNGQNTERVCRLELETVPCNLVIHLHDTKQLYTAGWNHGKFGSGLTQVIE